MGRRPDVEVNSIRRLWREKLYDPDFRDKTFKDQALELGVSDQTVSNWDKGLSEGEWSDILKTSREKLAKRSTKVDSSLYKKAIEGDVPAIKLWKESMEGWSPRQINENLNKNEIDSLTKEEAIRRVKELTGKVDLGVVKPEKTGTDG